MAYTINGIVLGVGAPNRTSDGRAVQCAILLTEDHGLCRIYADYGGLMNQISIWDCATCDVHIHGGDSRLESWKLDGVRVSEKITKSAEKRAILDGCVLDCSDADPVCFLNKERRSIAIVKQSIASIGYAMESRDFTDSPDWVTTQRETPQKPYVLWTSTAGKSHTHQLCAHEAYEWLRKNPSNTSQLWSNLRIEDIDYTKWLVLGNTNANRTSWVVVHLHRLKKTTQHTTLADFAIGSGRPSGWPYLQQEDLRAKRVASTGQQLLFTT